MTQTLRQRAGLHAFIERRRAPAVPRERQIAVRVCDKAQRGYADAGMGMLLPQSDDSEYMAAWRNRKHELDCCASVQP